MYTGQKIRLRDYRKEDMVLAHQFINDPEIKKNLVTRIPFPITFPEQEKWFMEISTKKDTYPFAIETLKEKRYIGGCGINEVDWKNSWAVVGIVIGDKNYLNKGYGTDAMRVLTRFIFEQMNIHKVKLFVFGFNERAIQCYKKCGFVREGVLRKELFRDGQYYDVYIMSILREDFQKLKPKR